MQEGQDRDHAQAHLEVLQPDHALLALHILDPDQIKAAIEIIQLVVVLNFC